jgi:hypothetical protein
MQRFASPEPLRCSFCHKSQRRVAKLLSSPSDYPRAYICDECVAVCAAILEDDRPPADDAAVTDSEGEHPLLVHPLVSQFLTSVERWVRAESLGGDAAGEFADMHSLAIRMMGDPGRTSQR